MEKLNCVLPSVCFGVLHCDQTPRKAVFSIPGSPDLFIHSEVVEISNNCPVARPNRVNGSKN